MEPAELLSEITRLAADKKAVDIVVLDLRGVLGYTDYFVICSGNTSRQARAIRDAIAEGIKHQHGTMPRRVEGSPEGGWRAVCRLRPPRSSTAFARAAATASG